MATQKRSPRKRSSKQPVSKTHSFEGKGKLEPKLRMVSNSNEGVAVLRADQTSSLSCRIPSLLRKYRPPRGKGFLVAKRRDLPVSSKRGKQKAVPTNVMVNVIVETTAASRETVKLPRAPMRRLENLMTATVSLRDLRAIAKQRGVLQVSMGEPLARPTPTISTASGLTPAAGRWRFGSSIDHHDGDGVLIGIIDVGGFDFSHPEFLDDGKTRFISIWDQSGDARPSPKGFAYGAEFTKKHLDKAIRSSGSLRVPAYEIERQSQIVPDSHATHVASIAAGNNGICKKASIAGVLISLPEGDFDRRRTFADSTRIIDAVEYLLALADQHRFKGVSINISLGSNGQAHDASNAVSRWLDSLLSVPGRSICVAAGNAGQEVPEFEGDRGYVMGRIHTSGRIPARDLVADIEWLVVGNGIVDASENELEVWYGAQDRFAVSIRPPGHTSFLGPAEPGQYIENVQLPGGSFLSIYNELYNPANGANYISIYLSPFYTSEALVGIPSGTWTVRLHGLEVRDGSYHAWIERDDPRRRGRVGDREFWNFPSFFSERSNVDNTSVNSLACGRYVISVANLDEAREQISKSSSQGPTRDNRYKPEVAAPGTNIVAARGFADRANPWVAMSGTSMASPYVTGVIGLMLAIEPKQREAASTRAGRKLTAAQLAGIIQRTSRPLPGSGFGWANDAGFGVINPAACLQEAQIINDRKDLKPTGRIRP